MRPADEVVAKLREVCAAIANADMANSKNTLVKISQPHLEAQRNTLQWVLGFEPCDHLLHGDDIGAVLSPVTGWYHCRRCGIDFK